MSYPKPVSMTCDKCGRKISGLDEGQVKWLLKIHKQSKRCNHV